MGEAKRCREFRARTTIPDHIKADIARVVHGVRVAGMHRATSGDPENRRATRPCSGWTQGAERQVMQGDRTNRQAMMQRPVWSESDPERT
jgi:hypothetical protein